jgi:hypothetical protein
MLHIVRGGTKNMKRIVFFVSLFFGERLRRVAPSATFRNA